MVFSCRAFIRTHCWLRFLLPRLFPTRYRDAAHWADEHHYLTGQALADSIQADQLPWDPSVQALLPFPSVLAMRSSDMNWTTDLGNAFLAQQQDVMDAVQRERRKARDFGYLADQWSGNRWRRPLYNDCGARQPRLRRRTILRSGESCSLRHAPVSSSGGRSVLASE